MEVSREPLKMAKWQVVNTFPMDMELIKGLKRDDKAQTLLAQAKSEQKSR